MHIIESATELDSTKDHNSSLPLAGDLDSVTHTNRSATEREFTSHTKKSDADLDSFTLISAIALPEDEWQIKIMLFDKIQLRLNLILEIS